MVHIFRHRVVQRFSYNCTITDTVFLLVSTAARALLLLYACIIPGTWYQVPGIKYTAIQQYEYYCSISHRRVCLCVYFACSQGRRAYLVLYTRSISSVRDFKGRSSRVKTSTQEPCPAWSPTKFVLSPRLEPLVPLRNYTYYCYTRRSTSIIHTVLVFSFSLTRYAFGLISPLSFFLAWGWGVPCATVSYALLCILVFLFFILCFPWRILPLQISLKPLHLWPRTRIVAMG